MAALTLFGRVAVIAAIAFAPLLGGSPIAGAVNPQATDESLLELTGLFLNDAEGALNVKQFKKAETIARQVAILLDAEPQGDAASSGRADTKARAWQTIARCRFAAGGEKGMEDAAATAVRFAPSLGVSEGASQDFRTAYENVRNRLAGWIEPVCGGGPCDRVMVDGQPKMVDRDGKIFLLEGPHAIKLSKANHKDAENQVEIVAGQRSTTTASMECIARDLDVSTTPAGVDVELDGTVRGSTQALQGVVEQGTLKIRSVPLGKHKIILRGPCLQAKEGSVTISNGADSDGSNGADSDCTVSFEPVKLAKAQARLKLEESVGSGVVLVNGDNVKPGTWNICPGMLTATMMENGRWVWFEQKLVRDHDELSLRPHPRPTVFYFGETEVSPPSLENDAWSLLSLDPDGAGNESIEGLHHEIVSRLGGTLPVFPHVAQRSLKEYETGKVLDLLKKIPKPEQTAPQKYDLLILVLPGLEKARQTVDFVVIDPVHFVFEGTSWAAEKAESGRQVVESLGRSPSLWGSFTGLDIVPLSPDGWLISDVTPNSPAGEAGLAPGDRLLDVAGQPLSGARTADVLADLPAGNPVKLRVIKTNKEEKILDLTPARVLMPFNPRNLDRDGLPDGSLILMRLARADVEREAPKPEDRARAAMEEGLLLASMGVDAEAARILDSVKIPPEFDPTGDARGTVAWVLEQLYRRLGKDQFAREAHDKWLPLEQARLGGRSGPPLANARQDTR
jgi:membrane-associated protease RseP (regulator of RpoE activity)